MTSAEPSVELEDRRRLVAGLVGLPPAEVSLAARLIADLHLEEITLFLLVTQLQRTNPHFEIPSQVPIEAMTVHDLCHYSLIMGEEHVDV